MLYLYKIYAYIFVGNNNDYRKTIKRIDNIFRLFTFFFPGKKSDKKKTIIEIGVFVCARARVITAAAEYYRRCVINIRYHCNRSTKRYNYARLPIDYCYPSSNICYQLPWVPPYCCTRPNSHNSRLGRARAHGPRRSHCRSPLS